MKIAIYTRVSTQEQSTENQEIPLIEYCQRMTWQFALFKEKESSRKTRPVQYELYKRLLRREFDGVLIYKFDRWARSSSELINHLNDFIEKDVRFISYTENVDLGTPSGKLMFTMLAAMAEFERDLIKERTIAGLNRARAQGKKLGRPKTKRSYIKKSNSKITPPLSITSIQ